MEFLEKNIQWLIEKIESKSCLYFLIDMPGQVELFTNHESLRNIMKILHQQIGLQCCSAHLVDSSYLMDEHKYLSACTLAMTAKIAFDESPVLNIVSKIDLLQKLGRPQMNLIDLENLSGLHYLFWGADKEFEDETDMTPKQKKLTAFNRKYGKLSLNLCELIENYMGFSGYLLLDISCRELVCHIIGQLDKSNGYFEHPEKVKNSKEAQIDYQAIEMYVYTQAV